MKRDNFIALVWGVAAGMLFALGMCMTMLPEWGAFEIGVVCGCAGLLLGLADLLWRRKKTGKPPIRVSGKALGMGALATAGALTLGLGMCLSMVWNQLIWGCVAGALGVLALFFLIPAAKGLRE